MNTRSIFFENYRNIYIKDSISEKSENLSNRMFIGCLDSAHLGKLIPLIGANNDGKNNVLYGIAKLSNKKSIILDEKRGYWAALQESDRPKFYGYEKHTPIITLEYKITDSEILKSIQTQKANEGIFSGKTFGIALRYGVVEDYDNRQKDRQVKTDGTCEEYWQEILDSEIYAFQDNSKELPEIRLMSKKYNRVCICSIESDRNARNSLSCVTVSYERAGQHNTKELIERDMKHAIKLDCKFVVRSDSRELAQCHDSKPLRDFLKEKSQAKPQAPIKQAESFAPLTIQVRVTLNENNEPLRQIGINNDFSPNNKARAEQILEKHFNLPLIPNIIFYEEIPLSDSDLEVSAEDLPKSNFFKLLCNFLEKDLEFIIKTCKEPRNTRKKVSEKLTEKCEELHTIFNSFYTHQEEAYSFSIDIEDGKIAFCMEKNGEAIYLSEQSSGFQKFFHFFFNFLYNKKIKAGDIVLLDEPENSLGIPAQKELRAFLEDFSRESGITFIMATHSPYMLDATRLDNVRIVKGLDSAENKGAMLINDFSMLDFGKTDALLEIKKALGANIEFSDDEEECEIIFVEGIMDYNILNGYKPIFAEHNPNAIKLLFLPISGLGGVGVGLDSKDIESKGQNELHFSDEQRQKAYNLIAFARRLRIKPILLVDNDRAGRAMKKGVEEEAQKDSKLAKLRVIVLNEAFKDGKVMGGNKVITTESLLSQRDREKFGFDICKENKEAGIASSVFRHTQDLREVLSVESKDNLKMLFEYLQKLFKQ